MQIGLNKTARHCLKSDDQLVAVKQFYQKALAYYVHVRKSSNSKHAFTYHKYEQMLEGSFVCVTSVRPLISQGYIYNWYINFCETIYNHLIQASATIFGCMSKSTKICILRRLWSQWHFRFKTVSFGE